MTKVRPPCTWELALTRIAGTIGWEKVADILKVAPRTASDWSEPDTRPVAGDRLTINRCVQLDAAYRLEGGDGAPLLSCYALRLETELAAACGSAEQLARLAAIQSREFGEANAALFAATQIGATDTDILIAERELEESIAAQTNTLATLRAGRGGGVSAAGLATPNLAAGPVPGGTN